MKLEIENGLSVKNPELQDIEKLLGQLEGKNHNFAILSKSSLTYIQVVEDPESRFVLEYQEGSTENHYRAKGTVSYDQVVSTFAKYASEEQSWMKEFGWVQIGWELPQQGFDEYPYPAGATKNNFLILLMMVLGGIIMVSPFLFERAIEERIDIEFSRETGAGYFLFMLIGSVLMLPSSIEKILQWRRLTSWDKVESAGVILLFICSLFLHLSSRI